LLGSAVAFGSAANDTAELDDKNMSIKILNLEWVLIRITGFSLDQDFGHHPKEFEVQGRVFF
jgi:hypothetical protein